MYGVVAPFPFETLPKLTRADVRAHAELRAARARVPEAAISREISALLQVPVAIRASHARAADGDPAAAIRTTFTDDAGRAYVVEAEPALARELVTRALKHPASTLTDPSRPSNADLTGAFAAIVHHVLRKSGVPPLRVVGAAPTAHEGITAHLAVDMGGTVYGARVTFPRLAFAERAPALGDFSIALPLVAARCTVPLGEIDALVPGDVFLVPGLTLVGPVSLIAPREERGILADLAADGRLVIRTGRFAHGSWDASDERDANANEMSAEANTTLEVALDAPVVVRVELGAVEMKAREWAALAEGDVIPLGRKLGDLAVLRIAGGEVARGELVQVDGEYGIRIVGTKR